MIEACIFKFQLNVSQSCEYLARGSSERSKWEISDRRKIKLGFCSNLLKINLTKETCLLGEIKQFAEVAIKTGHVRGNSLWSAGFVLLTVGSLAGDPYAIRRFCLCLLKRQTVTGNSILKRVYMKWSLREGSKLVKAHFKEWNPKFSWAGSERVEIREGPISAKCSISQPVSLKH